MDRSKKTYIIHNLGKSFLKENSYHNAHAKHFFNISKYEWKLFHDKVEKILKGSLDSILSLPSVKIQIMGGKFAWGVKAKHCCQQTFDNQKFVDITQQCFALLPQVNFLDEYFEFSLKVKVMGSNRLPS